MVGIAKASTADAIASVIRAGSTAAKCSAAVAEAAREKLTAHQETRNVQQSLD